MIKKVSIGILALIYLVVSSGIAMQIHYCMGKIASVGLYSQSNKCTKCGMKKNHGCCNDTFKIVKLEDAHKIVSNDLNIVPAVLLVDNIPGIYDSNLQYALILSTLSDHSPPELSRPSFSILHCVFRI